MSRKFRPTAEQKQFVEVLVAANFSKEQIAESLGIDAKTLRTNFAYELKHGASTYEARMIGSLLQSALGGNVSAARELERKISERTGVSTKGKISPKVLADLASHTAHIGTPWEEVISSREIAPRPDSSRNASHTNSK